MKCVFLSLSKYHDQNIACVIRTYVKLIQIIEGNSEVDLSTTKLSILAEVKQGNRAVFNAKVQ